VATHGAGSRLVSNPGFTIGLGHTVSAIIEVTVVDSEAVVVAVSGTTRLVRTVVVVVVTVRVDSTDSTDEMAVAGKVVTPVVVSFTVDCGMLKQEQAVEIAADSNFVRTINARHLVFRSQGSEDNTHKREAEICLFLRHCVCPLVLKKL
jgi:hypothetical protein